MRVIGEGGAGTRGAKAGNLYVRVSVSILKRNLKLFPERKALHETIFILKTIPIILKVSITETQNCFMKQFLL